MWQKKPRDQGVPGIEHGTASLSTQASQGVPPFLPPTKAAPPVLSWRHQCGLLTRGAHSSDVESCFLSTFDWWRASWRKSSAWCNFFESERHRPQQSWLHCLVWAEAWTLRREDGGDATSPICLAAFSRPQITWRFSTLRERRDLVVYVCL